MHTTDLPSVSLLGGTGRSGPGLAWRLARRGVRVHIGSRESDRGQEAAREITARLAALGDAGRGEVSGHDNAAAAALGDIAFVVVPHEGVPALLTPLAGTLAGRIVVSTVVPMAWRGALGPAAVEVPEGSAALQVAALVPTARVVAGFHSLSSAILQDPARDIDSDVLLTGDDAEAKAAVAKLAALLPGVRAVDAGPLRYSRQSEGLTVLLLAVNRANRGAHCGVVITDLPTTR